MISRVDLAQYLDQYLGCAAVHDYAPNGLQIEGKNQIRRLCTAVSANQASITAAIHQRADAILVHHGFFWRNEPSILTGIRRQRIATLLQHDLNLFAYHLPLDVHRECGNNACIARKLGIGDVQQYDVDKIKKGLWVGHLPEACPVDVFTQKLQTVFQQAPTHIAAQSHLVQRIAWCSGAAQDFIERAWQVGADAYISGEISERTFDLAKELNIHYFSCGHHATERYGVQALGEHLQKTFDIEHQFIDSDNPV